MKSYNVTHGATVGKKKSPEYQTYQNMLFRCYNPKSPIYKYYGGKGITVSRDWLKGFENFFRDMGKRPEGMTLERKDTSKGYSKSNCRWASNKDQQNNRTNNTFITYKGLTLTLSQWAEKTGMKYQTIMDRNRRKLPVEKIFEPIHKMP